MRGSYLPGDKIDDFHVLEVRKSQQLGGEIILMEHDRLNNLFLHIRCDDDENLFAFIVPTPPEDDTGLPHIMEHSVLGGSKKFPLKDPFFELVKTSLATFINAMTGTDVTVYPFSSVVKKDFFNLAEVYTDAIFNPLLDKKTFLREAWHYELTENDKLSINGIVYNEMKSAYSSPENHLLRNMAVNLFQDSVLRFDSGGFPEAIPHLTYEQFINFHKKRYSPENVFMFAYGSIKTEELTSFLSERLKDFTKKNKTSFIYPSQRLWDKPREVKAYYPLSESENLKEKTWFSLSWIVGDVKDAFEVACWMVLFQVLTGNDSSPLRKAIIESKLGADLAMTFLYPFGKHLVFSIGLKETEENRKELFKDLVFSVLKKCAEKGFKPEEIQSAVFKLIYQNLERNQNFILNLLWNNTPMWLHGNDPFTFLNMGELLDSVKNNAIGSFYLFSNMISKSLIDNPHRLFVTLLPDPEMERKTQKRLAEFLENKKIELGPEGLKKISEEANMIAQFNATNDPPEKLKLIPHLELKDLPEKPWELDLQIDTLNKDSEFLVCNVKTDRFFYGVCDVDISSMPDELLKYIPIYTELFQRLGTSEWNWVETAERKAASGRNFSCFPSFTGDVKAPTLHRLGLRFAFVSLDETLQDAIDVLDKLIRDLSFSDIERLLTVSRQYEATWRDRLLTEGLFIASAHSKRFYSPQTFVDYNFNGIPAFNTIKNFSESFEKEKDKVIQACIDIKDFIKKSSWKFSLAGNKRSIDKFKDFAKNLSSFSESKKEYLSSCSFQQVFEAISVPVGTSYSSIVVPSLHISSDDEPFLRIASELISSDYWLTQIRLKGGAYGAKITHDMYNSLWEFISFADPDFRHTWNSFKNIKDELSSFDLSSDRMNQIIIKILRNDVNPLKPEQAVHIYLSRFLSGEDKEFRKKRYQTIITASIEKVKKILLDHIEKNFEKSSFCVTGGTEQIKLLGEFKKDIVIINPFS